MKKKAFITYLIFVHFFIGIVLIKTDILSRIQARLGFSVIGLELTPYYYTMSSLYKRVDKDVPDNSVLFIGDSLIQGLAVSAVSLYSINYGIGGDTTFGVLKRLPHYSSLTRVRMVVIAIGVNDLKRRDNAEIAENYLKMVGVVPSTTPILFSAILPVDEVTSKKVGFNNRIRKINKNLKDICMNNQRLHFVDVASLITDSHGNLYSDYHIGDGVHLNSSGNRIWISELKESLSEACVRKFGN